ncbi:hypothetical protein BDW59DRAFT_166153 [Aspergillus cavernicola]|uniref:Uncharacterized protein n=1 Tax=Aspergillus cavernicola TaxID=176166 RepID=A0ABR4HNG0_9EURO
MSRSYMLPFYDCEVFNPPGGAFAKKGQGIPYVPFDIGPPTWLEEQRLLGCLLCVVLFYELRKTHTECSVVAGTGESVRVLLDDNVEWFWKTILWPSNDGQVEHIATLLHRLDEQAGGCGNVYS